MRIRFEPARPSAARTALVLVVSHGTAGRDLRRMRIGTGLSIATKDWDHRRQRLKPSAAGAAFTNRRLEQLRLAVEEAWHVAERTGRDPFETVRAALATHGLALKTRRRGGATILGALDAFLRERAASMRPNTLKAYRSARSHLRAFLRGDAPVERLAEEAFLQQFVAYLLAEGLTTNTIGKVVGTIGVVVRDLERRGVLQGGGALWRRSRFAADVTIVTLTRDELARIEALRLEDPGLERARRLFLAQCYTGVRYSDLAALRVASVEDGFIRLTIEKTGQVLAIPVTPAYERLLALCGGRLPEPPSNQVYNRHLKVIGRLAGLDDEVMIVRHRGAERVELRRKKWQVLTSHVARRTMITLSLAAGLPAELVMRVSGHRDMETFRRYVRLADAYVAEQMRRVWR